MKILYHHRTQALDGQRVHIREIQDALRAAGHEVLEVGPMATREVAGAEPARNWRRRLLTYLADHTPRGAYECLELGYNVVGFTNLVRAAHAFRPDLIYERYTLNTVAGTWAARWLKLPLLLEVNAPLADEKEKLGQLMWPKLARKLENCVLRNASRVLPVTGVLARRVTKSAALCPDKVVVIQNGVHPERFVFTEEARSRERQKLGVDRDIVVGAVGFFREWHGIDLLLHCLSRNTRLRERVRLLLVGDGPAVPSLRQQAVRNGIADRVIFAGSIPHNEVPLRVAAMDVVLLPRAVEYASPLKLFEYMAASKAIVAPRQENLLEVLTEDRDALCFTPENVDALEAAVCRLVEEEPLRRQLGEAARQTIERRCLTWEGSAARIVQVATDLLAERVRTKAARPAEVPGSLVETGAGR